MELNIRGKAVVSALHSHILDSQVSKLLLDWQSLVFSYRSRPFISGILN
ncbi:hypothetical protein Ngar_c08620 [Candidatus Nitrososphaera gargensis Ga9.2]|uniref:Uncharacterized protein n=1 Tax=Nitrososphaera gargensis (strain Ga9.2) TaxID=1237085 RepID=K0IMD1_NITGG|nr:hypothetical protein Ngar_c08620 [Candidatus Nitrososphaera gargensis Ga9.2]